ncbi:MAG: PDDEXK nuclease domain-containing protein, partial [Deltaproteobacteria bacterium]|nr:PDDEXK nuclease domain-containing protein [Deltaproteobacteria bacterium]
MRRKPTSFPETKGTPLYRRIRQILESAGTSVARSVNTTQVVANWLIGREIVEEEQRGKRRAGYGEELLKDLSDRLTKDREKGWSVRNLEYCRNFYVEYPLLIDIQKSNAVRSIFTITRTGNGYIPNALRSECKSAPWEGLAREKGYTQRSESWQPGHLHPNLSWTHYRTLLRVEKEGARAFYESEALRNSWSTRDLERQINSLLYERLALSKDKKGLMRLATKGQAVQRPVDVFKDPVVMEFLGLPESPRLVESDLEQALINNLQAFLLELGKGFA